MQSEIKHSFTQELLHRPSLLLHPYIIVTDFVNIRYQMRPIFTSVWRWHVQRQKGWKNYGVRCCYISIPSEKRYKNYQSSLPLITFVCLVRKSKNSLHQAALLIRPVLHSVEYDDVAYLFYLTGLFRCVALRYYRFIVDGPLISVGFIRPSCRPHIWPVRMLSS